MGATIHDRIAAILRHDDTVGAPLLHAPHSGYERLSMGGTTVIADTGLPPDPEVSGRAHAGCLSFEMSSGRHNFIVNAGVDTFGAPDFRPLARATAAHSTATLNDTSSARFNNSTGVNALIGAPLVAGPKHVPCERQDTKDAQGFVAVHDGYISRFGLYHERSMSLSRGGDEITGTDRFSLAGGKTARNNGRDFITIRFHVHPDMSLFTDEEDRLVLTATGTDAWVFAASGVEPIVEDSIFFAGLGGPRKTRQIVLAFRASEVQEVRWQLTRTRLAGS
jgi:uncharacterized heparinase superfamily protein